MAIFALPQVSFAQEVCVECSNPDTRYRCSIKDFEKIAKYRSSGKMLEFVCITELAKEGHHASCRAGNSFQGPCIGQPRELDPSKIGSLPPEPPPNKSNNITATDLEPKHPLPANGHAFTTKQPAGNPPQTLEELARDSKLDMSGVQNGVKKAGNAVGSAVKNSWRCISSLFKDC